MNRERMVQECQLVFWYNGQVYGSCNSGPYMGGMAHAALAQELGKQYPCDYQEVLDNGTDEEVQIIWDYIQTYLPYARDQVRDIPKRLAQLAIDYRKWEDLV